LYPAEEVQRILDYHWKANPDPYWRELGKRKGNITGVARLAKMIDLMAEQTPSKAVMAAATARSEHPRKLEMAEINALVQERLNTTHCETCNGTHHPPGEPLAQCPDCWEREKQIRAEIMKQSA
jgi:tRNA(Ile2) C34 agmatinyltransferase TiaS